MKLINSRILILAIGAFLFMGTLLGQEEYQKKRGERPNRQNSERILDKMSEDLDLSDEQKTEIKEILKSQKESRKEEEKESREEVQAEILEVLNPEQITAYNAQKAEREEQRAKKKEAQEAVKDFKEKNIEPFILQKRLELESILTEEDKASLVELRASQTEKNIKGNRKGQKRDRQRFSKEDRETLMFIAEKYEENISRFQGEIEGRQESWNSEIKAIREAYKWEEEGVNEEKESRLSKMEERKGKQERKGKKGVGKDVRFLLMDIE